MSSAAAPAKRKRDDATAVVSAAADPFSDCPICFEPLFEPHTGSCLHSVCASCAGDLQRRALAALGGTTTVNLANVVVSCVTCRAVSKLQRNPFLADVLARLHPSAYEARREAFAEETQPAAYAARLSRDLNGVPVKLQSGGMRDDNVMAVLRLVRAYMMDCVRGAADGARPTSLQEFVRPTSLGDTQMAHIHHHNGAADLDITYGNDRRACLVYVGPHAFAVFTRERDGATLTFRTLTDLQAS